MIVTAKRAALGVAGLFVAGMLVAWSGLFNVAASGGHWPITNWFLHWVMQNSVRTYALMTVETPPDLADPALLPAAAGHYAKGCAWCHAAPGDPQSAIALSMTPPPPALAGWLPAADWSDAELHRIVEHGVKYSGMPAWPSLERDDEVWSMVAFLKRLPALSPEDYRTLAFGPAPDATAGVGLGGDQDAAFRVALADCARCHAEDGRGRSRFIPVIGGQKEGYLKATLAAYRERRRESGFMQGAVAGYSPAMLDRLAAHFAAAGPALLPAPEDPGAPRHDAETLRRGEAIARQGVPKDGVPACLACHGARPERPEAAEFPRLDGQHGAYLLAQLRHFHEGARGGSAYARLMHVAVLDMDDADMEAVAAWFASLRPAAVTNP